MGSLEYAHARLSARYGARPGELDWRRIEPVRDLAPLLDAARATALRPWTTGIAPGSAPHAIEALLRRRWRDTVDEVASWMPEAWQDAVRWCALLPDLPAIAHLARGLSPAPWMREDPVLRELTSGPTGEASPSRPGALATLVADPDRVAAAWQAEWRRRLPQARGDSSLRDAIARALAAHFAAMRETALVDGTPLLRSLEARLALVFRRAMLDPAAAFAYLALVGLDAARLRGELLRRASFPGGALPGLASARPG